MCGPGFDMDSALLICGKQAVEIEILKQQVSTLKGEAQDRQAQLSAVQMQLSEMIRRQHDADRNGAVNSN